MCRGTCCCISAHLWFVPVSCNLSNFCELAQQLSSKISKFCIQDIMQTGPHSTCCVQEQRHRQVEEWMEEDWPAFRGMLERSGWSVNKTALCSSSWRGAWGDALHAHHN
jgi:hypothetical protein